MEDDYAYLEKQLEPKRADRSKERGRDDRPGSRDSRRENRDHSSAGRERSRSRERHREDRYASGERSGRDSYERRDYDRDSGRGGHGRGGYEDRGRPWQRGGGGGGGEGRGYGRRREPSPPETAEEKAAREQAKELKEMERATRTVFASNVNLRADEKDVFMFFSQVATVQDVQMIKDRSKKFKGFVYVELSTADEVFKALQLSGQPLLGQPVWVKSSEHERNLQWELEHARTAQLAEQQQAALAMPMQLMPGFAGLDAASLAMLAAMPGGAAAFGGMPLQMPGHPEQAASNLPQQDLDDIDDTQKGGLRLNAAARLSLMSKLAGSAGLPVASSAQPALGAAAQVDPGIALQQGMLGPASPIPTQYILLKNMFSPEEEAANGEGWDADIAKDVSEECSKFGPVIHCHVDKASMGHVYLKYASVESATAAQQALNGRWFAGRRIAAEFQFAHAYQQAFRT